MSRLALPRIGMGTAAIGNLYTPVGEAEARQAVQAALAAGITYFDTAPHYGFGLAERRLGEALGDAAVTISTKVGRLLVPTAAGGVRHGFADADPFEPRFDYSADGITRSYEDSLKRLRRDRAGILLAHDLGRETHGPEHDRHLRAFLDSGYDAMQTLKASGAIDAIGVGVNEVAICLDLLERGMTLDVVLIAGRYTLLDPSAADRLLPACAERGITVIVGGPYNSGILAQDDLGDPARLHYNYDIADPALVERARRLARTSARFGVPLPAAALQFPLRDARVSTVIAGLANPAEVAATVARAATTIPGALWETLAASDPLAQETCA